MQLLETVANVFPKRYHSSSEESIENLIYYKDCNHKAKEEATPLRTQPKPQECKMCCSMCCGDECVHNQHGSTMSRQSPVMSKSVPFRQSLPGPQPPLNPRDKRAKMRQVPAMQTPLGNNRRNAEFTRQHIRSLIAQDQDIRRILKDLVRVTMQKVDLMDMINTRRSGNDMEIEENTSEVEIQ